MNVGSSLDFAVTPLQTPWCTLNGDVEAGAGLTVPTLGLDYSNPSILSRTFPVAQCTTAPPSGGITVSQRVVGGAAPSANWTYSGDLGAFTLPAAGGSQAFPGLLAGSYTLNEAPQRGYLSLVSCSNGATGTSAVTVALTAGQSVTCVFTAIAPATPAPSVTGVSPTSGATAGGTQVTISGTNFSGATAVTFGATPATSFTVTFPTTITAVAPAEAAGTLDVRVTTPSGISVISRPADLFTFGSSVGGGPWPMFRHDLLHTGLSPYTGPATATLLWRYQTGGSVFSSPAIGADGSLKWRYQTGGQVFSSPAIGADGAVYIGSDDTYLYALNADGTLQWRYGTGSWFRSSPAIGADGTIYVGSDDGYLYAFGPGTAGAGRPRPASSPGARPAPRGST